MLRALVPVLACAFLSAQPLRLHPDNPRYFQYQGRTLVLVTSAEHYGAVLNSAFDFRRYLDTLSRDGMNYTRIFAGSYTEIPAQSFGILRNTLAPEPANLVSPWASTSAGLADLDQWNPAYFARLRDFLAEAHKRNILVEITLFSSHYQPQHWTISPFHPARNGGRTNALSDYKLLHTLDNGDILAHQERYVRKIVQETKSFPNVFYEIQNEPWSDRPVLAAVINTYMQPPARNRYPNSIDLADARSIAWQKRVASWIHDETRGSRLIAQNYCNFGAIPIRRANLAPEVSIVNFHYAYPAAALDNANLGLLLGYDETGFMSRNAAPPEGTAPSDDAYLREAWNFLLSGGALFNSLDYSFTAGHEDGSDTAPNGPGGGSPQLRRGLRILREFLDSLPLEKMKPGATFIAPGHGVSVRPLAGSGVWAAYWDGTPEPRTAISLQLAQGAKHYEYLWLDPRTGTKTAPAPVPANRQITTPAFPTPVLLVRERRP